MKKSSVLVVGEANTISSKRSTSNTISGFVSSTSIQSNSDLNKYIIEKIHVFRIKTYSSGLASCWEIDGGDPIGIDIV